MRLNLIYWYGLAQHAFLLLHHTPNRFLNFHLLKLTNISKVAEKTTKPFPLTHEQYSDAMRFLEIDSGKIIIIRDFIVPSALISSKEHKKTKTLPNEVRKPQNQWVQLPVPKLPSPINRDYDN
ncbi:hypothetical protein O181_006667 [Austropuccinia psidii MF-1]|uniref:Uncharacterized protein n=1 Tax=Austropuccinia psidii MF-1 TaxID=1389203 RepID=A0A9Q3BL83_9BASI|nr:hypothetical protein [Austropuccinia psidii MF-1]